jgi:hypothetical protein
MAGVVGRWQVLLEGGRGRWVAQGSAGGEQGPCSARWQGPLEDDRNSLKAPRWKVVETGENRKAAGRCKGGWKTAEAAGTWQRSLEDSMGL